MARTVWYVGEGSVLAWCVRVRLCAAEQVWQVPDLLGQVGNDVAMSGVTRQSRNIVVKAGQGELQQGEVRIGVAGGVRSVVDW